MSPSQCLTGVVFNIQRFSLHDGPGIRTLVFMKGCPLRCRWCSNPEGLSGELDIICHHTKCMHCGACLNVCPRNAIGYAPDTGYVIDRTLCNRCGKCAKFCPTNAKEACGEVKTIAEIVAIVERDRPFYNSSGGGLTMGGGEILFQPEFTYQVLKKVKALNVNTAIETSGCGRWEDLERLADVCDTIHFDMKAADSIRHKQITGLDNHLILENLIMLDAKLGGMDAKRPSLVLRLPLIEGYNADLADVRQAAAFIKTKLRNYTKIEILPFHNLGESKYARLDLAYELAGRSNAVEASYQPALLLMQQMGLPVVVSKW